MLSKNQIKEIQSLQLKKNRDISKVFIAEGIKSTIEIIEERPEIIKSVFATADFLKKHGADLNKKNIHYTPVEEEELKKISMQTSPNQVLTLCNYFIANTIKKPEQSFYFFLDDIRDPGNFGTILRLGAWFGLQNLYCSPASCDLYNPKVIQSTMGAFLRVNVHYKSLEEVIADLQPAHIYGAVLDGKNIYEEKLKSGLVVIGNEANGISDENLKLITNKLTIPSGQISGAESLNAAMAASIMASEFFRQLR